MIPQLHREYNEERQNLSFFLRHHPAGAEYPLWKGVGAMAADGKYVAVCPVFPEEGEDLQKIFLDSFRIYLRRMLTEGECCVWS
jgi:hypothetical protein